MDSLSRSFVVTAPMIEQFLVNLLIAVVILIVGWLLAGFFGKLVERSIARAPRLDATIIPIFRMTVTWSIRFLTLIIVLSQFGIRTASLIAVVGAAGVAIGLALQGTLQNIAAGIMLLFLRPMSVGEQVTIVGINGEVKEIGLFLTKILQFDGVTVTLPNSVVWNNTITNFSRNGIRRMDVLVRVSYGEDLDKAMDLLVELSKNTQEVLLIPLPEAFVSEYRDSVVIITLRVWTHIGQFTAVQSKLMKLGRQTLEQAGYRMPLPSQIQYIERKGVKQRDG